MRPGYITAAVYLLEHMLKVIVPEQYVLLLAPIKEYIVTAFDWIVKGNEQAEVPPDRLAQQLTSREETSRRVHGSEEH